MSKKRVKRITFEKAVLEADGAMGPYIRHMRGRAVSQNTLNDYHNAFRLWLQHMGNQELRDITVEDIDDFLALMAMEPVKPPGVAPRPTRQRSKKTLSNYRTALSSLWTWAVARGYADDHVVRGTRAPRVHHKPIVPLTKSDMNALVKATAETRPWHNKPLTTSRRATAERDRFLILLLYETMARITEAIMLRIGDVAANRRGGQITILHGKGDKTRVVPFGRQTARAFYDWIETREALRDDDWLFVNLQRRQGTQMTRNVATRLVKRLGQSASIQRTVTPHLLRTTGACHQAPDLSAWELMRRMGHSDIKTTLRYVRAAEVHNENGHVTSPADKLRL